MRKNSIKRLLSLQFVTILLIAAPLSAGPAANANSNGSGENPVDWGPGSPLVFGGYNVAVAAENGFTIETAEDGKQRSIPKSTQARSLVQKASKYGLEPRDTATGNCGTAWLNGSKGQENKVSFRTGYSVRLPVQFHQWRVSAQGFITSGEKNYAQGSGASIWYVYGVTTAIGPGRAVVPPFSPTALITLIDGSVCYSNSPGFGFD
ncbi:hypothetical protein M2390_000434 [Mycetocola sp. BIGb0189]|uniref:hypothetical protein n=1 Tax=Mycetocola sp. BIGb0189 TaxID=2940604 RepID=UPI00216950B1|nr:hypothetical protein [Mycetocola sp. BIGb0189]MCS4275276.1 hypothetical protein [Mycetocola sp. BIGb0189]